MQTNYLHKQCSSTSKKFFHDFDLLPTPVKELLWYSPKCPDFEDLKEAWRIAGEQFKINLLNSKLGLFAFEEERKAESDEENRKKREAKKREKLEERMKRLRKKYQVDSTTVYVKRTRDDTSKHGNLIRRVMSDQEAASLLTRRKENKDVSSASKTYYEAVIVPVAKAPKEEAPLNFAPTLPNQSPLKQWHNS